MTTKEEISEAFNDFGFCAENPSIIDRLYTLSVKYGMNQEQLAGKYLEFAHTELSSYQLNFGNLCLFELLLDNKEKSKLPAAQLLEKGTENESGVYDTKVSVESDLDAMIDEMINTPVEEIQPSGRKSMVAQFLEKGTGNESAVQDITVSVPSEKAKVIPNPFMGKKFLGNDVPI